MLKFILIALFLITGCARTEKFLNVNVSDNSMKLPLPDKAVSIRRDFNRYDYFKLGSRFYCLGVVNIPNSSPQVFVFEVDEDTAYGRSSKKSEE